MAKLNSPRITVTFTELGITAIGRGEKGTVAVILRDAAEHLPVILTQASQIPKTLGVENQRYLERAFLGYVNPPKKVIIYPLSEDAPLEDALGWMEAQTFDYIVGPVDCTPDEAGEIASWVKSHPAAPREQPAQLYDPGERVTDDQQCSYLRRRISSKLRAGRRRSGQAVRADAGGH